MPEALLVFTKKCNLQCRHCCDNCGPYGETMSWGNIERVLGHLEEGTDKLILTGGEPFVEQELLYRILQFVAENKSAIMPAGEIHIQTNGFWTVNEQQAYGVLKSLQKSLQGKGAYISILSKDEFHQEQGLDIEKLSIEKGSSLHNAMQRLARETEGFVCRTRSIIELRPGWIAVESPFGSVMPLPFGRAKNLEEVSNVSHCTMGDEYGNRDADYTLTIRPDGQVYPCCWHATPPIGSAAESPLEELVENMRSDKVFRTLIRKGLAETAMLLGTYRKEDAEAYEKNPCSKCGEVFGGYR